ncbi:MAG TPA: cyclic nucleotide-binding protein, partial [Flavobacterium sp.]|nr:cyclic nucleotide-binding protein [Flavobacterium sp.]
MKKDTTDLLQAENQQLKKLQEIVKKSIKDENLIIENLLHPPKDILSKGQQISDRVARFGGCWAFIM